MDTDSFIIQIKFHFGFEEIFTNSEEKYILGVEKDIYLKFKIFREKRKKRGNDVIDFSFIKYGKEETIQNGFNPNTDMEILKEIIGNYKALK